jgi:hypothetical protein
MYDYRDESRTLLYQVVRFEPKDFRQRRPDDSGGWIWSTKGLRPLLYHRDKLQGRETVVIAEGEKDVDRLWSLGLSATCNAGGAGKWKPTHTQQLIAAGVKRVVVIPDGDDPGLQHAEAVARSCASASLIVRIVALPPPAKDATEYFDRGGSKDDLIALVKATAVYAPTAEALATAAVTDVPLLQCMAGVRRESVRWHWSRRIARGKLALAVGEPGEGKSSLFVDVTARTTTGATWPDGGHAPQGPVLLLSAEDGLSDTIGPRLDACGADSQHVHVLTAIRCTDGTTRGLDLGRDVAALEAAIRQVRPVLVVIDPLSAYLGRADTWKDSEVRALLAPLAALAEQYDCAILGVMHLSKGAGRKALHRAMGSIGFVAAARIVLAVARDPDDEERRLLLPVKNNLSPPADVLAFRLNEGRVVWESGPVHGVTADSVLNAMPADAEERQDAQTFLRDMLASGERVDSKAVVKAARANGISERTLKRAKARLGVQSKHTGFGATGKWHWWLPVSESQEPIPINTVALSDEDHAKTPIFSQRVPERAKPRGVAPSGGTLCAAARECQERANLEMAPSAKALRKSTESTERATNEDRESDHADDLDRF